MSEQSLQNYNATETSRAQHSIATEEDGFVVAAKRGDSAAFEMLCKQSANTVFHIARRMMRTKEDAEDVMQESFQLAFIHLKSFKGGSRFSTWLSRIAINASLMNGRREETPHERPVAGALACKVRSRAMHVINARRKGGSHGYASAPHYIGDFDTPVFHRPGCHRPQTSPLNQNPQRERADIAQPSAGIVVRF